MIKNFSTILLLQKTDYNREIIEFISLEVREIKALRSVTHK